MADKTPLVAAVQTELAITLKSGLPVYTYVYRRSYTCGHVPEFIKVSKSANQEGIVQTVLRLDQVEKESQVRRWLKYRLGRCRSCAVRLRENHKSMQESGNGEGMRPIADYQGEGIRPDRALLREAKSGFSAALKQLDRVNCCGGEEEEEEWPLTREVVGGDADSVRVVKFLDGRRKVDSPTFSPSPFPHGFNDPWSLRGGGDVGDSHGLADCAAYAEERQRQRKDSAFEGLQNADLTLKNGVHALRRAGTRKENIQDVYLEAPRTPMAFTSGLHSDPDWLRFSYLLRNNQLSFDDIAELVSRYSLDDSDPLLNDIAQHSLSVDHQPNVCNSISRSSIRQPGLVEWDVSSGYEDSQAQNISGGGRNGEMEEQAIRVEDSGDMYQSHHDRYSDEPDVSQSCFSSDSSVDSIDFSKPEVNVTANRTRPSALPWWKLRRKYDGIQEYPVGLWKKISKKTSNRMLDRNPQDEVTQQPQARLSKIEETSLRASRVSQRPVNHDNDCHPVHRKQAIAPNVQSELSTSSHMFNAMEAPNSPRTSPSMTSNTTKSQRGNHNSPACLTKSRPSSSTHSTKIAPHGIHPVHRPYKPSPLKHFTRVTSLDVNKGLPPLPPEARRLAHQASMGMLQEVAAVRKVAIRKVMNEYVDQVARAY